MRIARRDGGYALDIYRSDVDVHCFRELRSRADATVGAASAVTLLKQAESLWRGEAFAGLTGDWVRNIRVTLEEELREVTARRVELELSLGRHAQLHGELAGLTERYPTDATFAAQRMLALFRTGRQTDALRVYQQVKITLLDEGLNPEPLLEDLYLRILRHDPDLFLKRDQRPISTLPSSATDFVGRDREMAELLAASGVRIVEGMGGIGKTELAVHAARAAAGRFPDGQLYLNLRGTSQALDPADALRDLLVMVGAEVSASRLAERRQQWLDELATRKIVLVLDDATGPDQVGPLIPENTDCLVIVTSRRRTDWGAWERLRLDGLPEVDAVRMFTAIVGRDVGQSEAAEIVRLCDGLPLAIKLAAVQTRTSAVDDVLRELRDRDGIAEGVGAAFVLSYRRLPEDARRFFRYLGMNPCRDFTPATTAAAADVTEATAATLLAALKEQSLLEQRSSRRFIFHDLVRSYARSLSRAHDTEPEVMNAIRRLAEHYAREAERAGEILRSRDHVPGLGAASKSRVARRDGDQGSSWFAAEYENILLLAEYCGRHERNRNCVQLVRTVSDFLGTSGHWGQALHAHEFERRACRDMGDTHAAAEASLALSQMCLRTGRLHDGEAYASEAKTFFGQTGDRRGWSKANDILGVACRYQARFRAALAHHEEAIGISRATGDPTGAAQAMFHAATALHMLGRLTEEMAYLSEALGVFRQGGDLRSQGLVHNSIGLIHLDCGYHRDAVASFHASYEIFREIGGRQNLAVLEHNMGKVHQYRGRREAALTMYRRALAEFRSMGDLRNEALVRADIGSVLCESKSYAAAVAEHDRALAIAELMGDRYTYVLAVCGIADARRESDALDAAFSLYERAERLAAQIEAEYPRARALHGLAEVMLLRHDEDAARIYWRESLDIYQALGSYLAGIVAMRLEPFSHAA